MRTFKNLEEIWKTWKNFEERVATLINTKLLFLYKTVFQTVINKSVFIIFF